MCGVQACLSQNDEVCLPTDLQEQLVSASCSLLSLIQQNLQPCELPGRGHYCFSLKDLTKVFQVKHQFMTRLLIGVVYCKHDVAGFAAL